MANGTYYCARITAGLPAGYTAIRGTGNNTCYINASTYEWQVAGQNQFANCSYSDQRSWDLSADNAINFVVDYPPPCTCGSWSNVTCGAGGCSADQMQQTRTCNPSGCQAQSQCAADGSCDTLTVNLAANPSSGNAPLTTQLVATVGGTVTGTIHYTLWTDCNSSCGTLTACQSACGAWNQKNDGASVTTYTVNTTYSTQGTYSPRIIVERGSKTAVGSTTVVVGAPLCACGSWAGGSCGAGGCSALQRQQTRTCNPVNCLVQSQCVNDAGCCTCGAWSNATCGGGGCSSTQRQQTRSCSPSGCQAESQCMADSVCACSCGSWSDDVCGGNGCPADKMHQSRTCSPAGCQTQDQCVSDPGCPLTLNVSLTANPASGASPLDVSLQASVGGNITGTVNYTIWWDCNNACSTVASCQTACGTWGSKKDGEAAISYSFAHAYTAAGNYMPKIIVERGSLSAVGSASVAVSSGNSNPTVSSATATQGDYCTSALAAIFNWNYADADSDPQSSYQLQVSESSSYSNFVINTGKIDSASTSYAAQMGTFSYAKTYYWRIKVWDNRGGESSWYDGSPFTTAAHEYPLIDFSWTPTKPVINEAITFTGQVSVFGGSTVQSKHWIFESGDPATSTNETPQVTWTQKGTFKVSLAVIDSDGFSCTRQKNFLIKNSLPDWGEVSYIGR